MDFIRPGMLPTSAGLNLFARGQTGERIEFTRIAVGDGTFDFDTEDYLTVSDLKSWKMDLPKESCKVTGDGQATLTARLKNTELTQGFYLREAAVFARDPDDPEKEICYAYCNVGDDCTYVPPKTSGTIIDLTYRVIIVVGAAENVSIVIDANMSYVSQTEFEEHIEDENPHPNLNVFNLAYAGASSADYLCAIEPSGKTFRRITIADLASQILGGTVSTGGESTADNSVMNRLKEIEEKLQGIEDEFSADKILLEIPTVQNLTFNGEIQSAVVGGYDHDLIAAVDDKGRDAGDYTATFALKDMVHCRWADGLTVNRTRDWNMAVLKLEKPTAETVAFVYSEDAHTLTLHNFDERFIEQIGTIEETNAGGYQAIFHLKSDTNTTWTDGTTADVTIPWTIAKQPVEIPAVTNTTLTYNRDAQSPTITGVVTKTSSVAGDVATVVGDYEVTISLNDPDNYFWTDETIDDKVYPWKIEKCKVALPTVANKTYTGEAQTAIVGTYDSTIIDVTGTGGVTVGEYEVTFSLIDPDNYCWTSLTTSDVTKTWNVTTLKLAKPTIPNNSTEYNTQLQTIGVNNFVAAWMTQSGDNTGTEVGSYNVTYTLKDTDNTSWNDASTSPVTLTWYITKIKKTVPSQSGSLTYNGSQQTPSWNNYDSSVITLSGIYQNQTNAGSYNATFSLNDTAHYQWTDGTGSTKTVSWKIDQQKVSIPYISGSTSFVCDGTTKEPTIYNFDSNTTNQSGTSSTSSVGNYTITWSLKSTSNYQWTDGTTSNKTANWSVTKMNISIPSLSGTTSFTYDGNSKTVSTNYDTTNVTQSGTITSTNAGSFTVTWSLKNTSTMQWTDGTTGNKTATWTIEKLKINKPSISGTKSFTYDGGTKTVSTNYESAYVDQRGTTSASDAGDYTVTWLLKDSNVTWTDGTISDISEKWTITQIYQSYSVKIYNTGETDSKTLSGTATNNIVSLNFGTLSFGGAGGVLYAKIHTNGTQTLGNSATFDNLSVTTSSGDSTTKVYTLYLNNMTDADRGFYIESANSTNYIKLRVVVHFHA